MYVYPKKMNALRTRDQHHSHGGQACGFYACACEALLLSSVCTLCGCCMCDFHLVRLVANSRSKSLTIRLYEEVHLTFVVIVAHNLHIHIAYLFKSLSRRTACIVCMCVCVCVFSMHTHNTFKPHWGALLSVVCSTVAWCSARYQIYRKWAKFGVHHTHTHLVCRFFGHFSGAFVNYYCIAHFMVR